MLKAGPKTGYHGALPDIDDDVEWFETVTGTSLYEWQAEELRALRPGHRPRSHYVQVARKNGKSLLGAAAAICEARRPGRHIYTIADSERNLDSALMREIRDIIAASPVLSAAYVPFQKKLEVPSTGSFIETRPNNFRASQSINPHMVIFDEVHLQRTDDIWHGMRMAGAARPDSVLLGITTPGMDLTAPAMAFYEQVRAGTMSGRIFEPANPDTAYDDRAAWVEANPRLRDDPGFMAALEEDRRDLPEHQFRRFRLGLWTATDTAWLPYGAWDACADPKSPVPPDGARVWLGFDGSYSGDSTALVGASDGHLFVVGCWESPGRKGWRVPRDDVDDVVSGAMARWDAQLLCDPPYWGREIEDWKRRWGEGRVLEFPTFSIARMAPATTLLHAAVMDQRVTHDGDPRLARHVANCVVKTSSQGDVITKADKDSPAKIDLAVAASIAHLAMVQAAPARRRVFVR